MLNGKSTFKEIRVENRSSGKCLRWGVGFLIAFLSASAAADVADEVRARIASVQVEFPHILRRLSEIEEVVCSDDHEVCMVTECDIQDLLEPGRRCRADYVVLFRAESRIFDFPATSRLMIELKNGSDYFDFSRGEGMLMEKLNDDIALIPSQLKRAAVTATLTRTQGKSKWKFVSEQGGKEECLKPSFSPFLMSVNTHVEAAPLRFQSERTSHSLDYLVSFSLRPGVIRRFARPAADDPVKRARVIAISYPMERVNDHRCPTQLPSPGTLVNSELCRRTYSDYDEAERSVALRLDPGTILRSWTFDSH